MFQAVVALLVWVLARIDDEELRVQTATDYFQPPDACEYMRSAGAGWDFIASYDMARLASNPQTHKHASGQGRVTQFKSGLGFVPFGATPLPRVGSGSRLRPPPVGTLRINL